MKIYQKIYQLIWIQSYIKLCHIKRINNNILTCISGDSLFSVVLPIHKPVTLQNWEREENQISAKTSCFWKNFEDKKYLYFSRNNRVSIFLFTMNKDTGENIFTIHDMLFNLDLILQQRYMEYGLHLED